MRYLAICLVVVAGLVSDVGRGFRQVMRELAMEEVLMQKGILFYLVVHGVVAPGLVVFYLYLGWQIGLQRHTLAQLQEQVRALAAGATKLDASIAAREREKRELDATFELVKADYQRKRRDAANEYADLLNRMRDIKGFYPEFSCLAVLRAYQTRDGDGIRKVNVLHSIDRSTQVFVKGAAANYPTLERKLDAIHRMVPSCIR